VQKKIDLLEAEEPVFKSMEQINSEFDIHKNGDIFLKDIANLKEFYHGARNKSKVMEEKNAEFLSKKYSYRPKSTFRL
jgi:hypothetical protein